MNCTHCRQLIEAGPLPELAPAQFDALQQHTASCPDCRHTLGATRHFEERLATLPDPVLPDGLEAAIMQRIFDRQADQALATATPAAMQQRPLGSIVLGGMLAIGAELVALLNGGLPMPYAESLWQAGSQAYAAVPHGNLGIAMLAVGLLLMLSGLTQTTDSRSVANNGK